MCSAVQSIYRHTIEHTIKINELREISPCTRDILPLNTEISRSGDELPDKDCSTFSQVQRFDRGYEWIDKVG